MAKRIQNQRLEEFQPPEKKLVSEADLLIKDLVKKQANTNINLTGQLAQEKAFENSSSFLPITNYQSGQCSVTKLKEIIATAAEYDDWKSAGLCDEDVRLYNDYREGIDVLYKNHPKYERNLLMMRIEAIEELLKIHRKKKKESEEGNPDNPTDLTTEKPESNEAKLLRFALKNKEQQDQLPHPMDMLKDMKSDLEYKLHLPKLTHLNMNKIRRKVRKLQHRLEVDDQQEHHTKSYHFESSSKHGQNVNSGHKLIAETASELRNKYHTSLTEDYTNRAGHKLIAETASDLRNKLTEDYTNREANQELNFKNDLLCEGTSKWDVKTVDSSNPKITVEQKKVYDCKPQTLYTVKNGEIVSLDRVREIECTGEKMTLEDIKKLPQFENYSEGALNNVLYVKNFNKVSVEHLKYLCVKYGRIKTDDVEFKVMSGRMKGQAFITFADPTIASGILKAINGLVVNGKPLIVQYGRKT